MYYKTLETEKNKEDGLIRRRNEGIKKNSRMELQLEINLHRADPEGYTSASTFTTSLKHQEYVSPW
jgi:hypothetical protein